MIPFEGTVKREIDCRSWLTAQLVGLVGFWKGIDSSKNDQSNGRKTYFLLTSGQTEVSKRQAVTRDYLSQELFTGLSCCLLAESAADSNAPADSFKRAPMERDR
jgi:hypothetical protein